MRVLATGLLATFALFGTAPPAAEACSCVPQKAACEAAWQATAIFIGEVERIEPIGPPGRVPQLRRRLVTFKVSEHFRGPGGTVMRVRTGAGGGDCGYRFTKGRRYIVYAFEDRDGQLQTGTCSRTRPLDQAADDVAFARAAFQRNEPLGQISGALFRRTIDLIRDRTRDKPAAGAAITLMSESQGFRVVANEQGHFSVHGLPPGRYRATVEVGGSEYFLVRPEVVEIADARGCATVDAFILADGRVRGRVLDAARQPVAGLTVELGVHFKIDGPSAQGHVRAVTAHDGTFELTHVPPGEYVVGVNFARDEDGTLLRPRLLYPGRVKVAATVATELADFILTPALRYVPLTGVVVAADGGPVAGARVFLKGERYVEGEPVVTDAAGRFTIAALAGAEYVVFAERASGESSARRESSDAVPVAVSASASAPPPLTLTLRRRY